MKATNVLLIVWMIFTNEKTKNKQQWSQLKKKREQYIKSHTREIVIERQ